MSLNFGIGNWALFLLVITIGLIIIAYVTMGLFGRKNQFDVNGKVSIYPQISLAHI